ncbi:hypothetical protein AgCh_006642 [Apium graveolens]
MFGNPSVMVTTPETCKRVLTDDDAFMSGWPASTIKLMGEKSFFGLSYDEHKRLRRLTAAPINGKENLSVYMYYIEYMVKSALDKWSKMEKIEFLTEVRKLSFRIITYILLSSESEARKKLVAIFQSIVNERRSRIKNDSASIKKDMMDALLFVEDENGRNLNDDEIIDAEQKAIAQNKSPNENGITFEEFRKMDYLSKVIDETLRVITLSLTVFREAKKDVKLNGYLIPKGWKTLVWFRSVHHNSEIYHGPMKFNPSRWDATTSQLSLSTHVPLFVAVKALSVDALIR